MREQAVVFSHLADGVLLRLQQLPAGGDSHEQSEVSIYSLCNGLYPDAVPFCPFGMLPRDPPVAWITELASGALSFPGHRPDEAALFQSAFGEQA